MKSYKKLYLNFFGYDIGNYVPSEMSNNPAIDIHHLQPRGMGSSKSKDYIENLVALTREEHIKAEADKTYNHEVQIKHLEYIMLKRPDYKLRSEYNELLKTHYEQ